MIMGMQIRDEFRLFNISVVLSIFLLAEFSYWFLLVFLGNFNLLFNLLLICYFPIIIF